MKVLAVGTEAEGFFAFGQQATGVVAVGQLAVGVVAIGQLSRGIVAIGQLSAGLVSFGQLSIGGLWSGGMVAIAPTAGFALVPGGLLGQWVPWRRRRPRWMRSRGVVAGVRALIALALVATVVVLSVVPLARDLFGHDGVFGEPPVVLR